MIKKFGLENSQDKRKPAATEIKLIKDCLSEAVDLTIYRSMIGSLYLTASHPDIAYVVGVCARFQSAPRHTQLQAAKRIIKYIQGTADYGIHYSFGTTSALVG